MAIRIDTKRGRAALEPRPDPYYVRIGPGRALGYRKTLSGSESWLVRWRDAEPDAAGKRAVAWHALGPVTETFQFDDARAAAEAWLAARDRGIATHDATGAPPTVEAACREYVEDRRKARGEACANAAATFFERHVYGRVKSSRKRAVEADALASIRLDRLRTRHLADFRDRLLAGGLSRGSVVREMSHVVAALNLAVQNRLVTADRTVEWQTLPRLRYDRKRRELYLDREQRAALVEAATGGVRDLIEAAALTGCRAGELTSMRVAQFDGRTGSLTVAGKTGRRTFPLSPHAVELLTRLARSKLPNAYLLTRDDGLPFQHSDWDEHVRAAAAAAGLPAGACLYTLRHSFITSAMTAGLSAIEVARLTGTSLKMIDAHYGHLAVAGAREKLARLAFL